MKNESRATLAHLFEKGQTMMIDISKLIPKAGNYRIASSGAITDLTLMDVASQYESQISQKMVALIPEQIPRRFSGEKRVLETTKVDGEGVFIYFDRQQEIPLFAFNAPSGRVRLGLPVLEDLQQHLEQTAIQKGLFRSELYLPKLPDGRRAGIAAVLRSSFSGTQDEIEAFRILMLDIIMLDGKDLRPNQEQFQITWDQLDELFGHDPSRSFHCPEGSIVTEPELPQIFDQKVAQGEEGMVIRRLERLEICKVKPRLSLDAVIVGYVEGEYEGQYGVTSMLIAMSYPQAADQSSLTLHTLLRVGSGLTDEQRAEYLRIFSDVKVDSPLTMTDQQGRPVSFVKPVYLAEISAEDLMTTIPGTDRPNRTQVLEWDPQQESYRFIGLAACSRPTFATFIRLRQDKQLEEGGARIAQILPDVTQPNLMPPIPQESRVIRREVFTKGQEMVRKLVMVQKRGGEETVPYLIYWTDFSSKRKDPLKVTVSYAFTEGRAQALAEKLIQENVVRGWSPINPGGH